MVTAADFDGSWHEFGGLADALDALVLPAASEWTQARELQERAIRTIRSYLIPRVRDPELPMLVVFAGPTGAGKSTLLNSVAGRDLTATGPLRPTTTAPVVFVSDAAAGAYRNIGGVECEIVEGHAPILSEMALVDTPDIDSTSVEHRAMAEVVIDNADVVVFVSSALRYADLVPWEVLRRAGSRGAPVINVLNRIRADSGGALFDYVAKLRAEGLDSDAVAIHEHHMMPGAQSVPLKAVRELRRSLVEHLGARSERARETFGHVLSATVIQVGEVLESSRHALEQSERAALRADDALQQSAVDLGDPLDTGRLGLNLDSVSGLAGQSRRAVNRWMRRYAPAPELVAAARRRLVNRIISSVEADLRRKLSVLGEGTPVLFEATYEILLLSVERWAQSVEEAMSYPTGRLSELAALLMMASSVGADERYARAARMLASAEDVTLIIETARESLMAAIDEVYARVRRQAVEELRQDTPTEANVDAVWALLSEVIARSSFAHA